MDAVSEALGGCCCLIKLCMQILADIRFHQNLMHISPNKPQRATLFSSTIFTIRLSTWGGDQLCEIHTSTAYFFFMHILSASMHRIENLKCPYLSYGWCDSVQWITNWTENRLKTRVSFACGWMNAMYFLKWLNKLSIYLDRTITEFQIFFSVCCFILSVENNT